jgi:hypothetical protein
LINNHLEILSCQYPFGYIFILCGKAGAQKETSCCQQVKDLKLAELVPLAYFKRDSERKTTENTEFHGIVSSASSELTPWLIS